MSLNISAWWLKGTTCKVNFALIPCSTTYMYSGVPNFVGSRFVVTRFYTTTYITLPTWSLTHLNTNFGGWAVWWFCHKSVLGICLYNIKWVRAIFDYYSHCFYLILAWLCCRLLLVRMVIGLVSRVIVKPVIKNINQRTYGAENESIVWLVKAA